MECLKNPGPDGFQAVFYKSQWSIVGQALYDMVKRIFQFPYVDKDLNETLITLIPKVEKVSKMKDFRPISLCNVSYKVITKLLAYHL